MAQGAPASMAGNKMAWRYDSLPGPPAYWSEATPAASLMRESLWSMVSEVHSRIDCDFEAYTADNLVRFERAWSNFAASETG